MRNYNSICFFITMTLEAVHGDAVCSDTMLQAGRSRVRFPKMQSLGLYFYLTLSAALWSCRQLSV